MIINSLNVSVQYRFIVCMHVCGYSLVYIPQNKIAVPKSMNTFIVLVIFGNCVFCTVFIV